MHIPDNYLSPATCAVMGAVMVPVWTVAVRKVTKEVERARVPLLGIGAALSFLVMMFNVPVPGGTTAHAVGGTLLAIVLGPWSACISVSIALLVQALLFGDGGILAFGANCFNMAFVLPFLGYFIYRFISQRVKGQAGEYVAVVAGSHVGINIAALAAAIEFGLQPVLAHNAAGLPLYCPYPLSVSIPAMLIPHLAVAGVVEAGFTAAIVAFIRRVSPGMIREAPSGKIRWIYAVIVVMICLSPLGLLAAGTAWGEWGPEEIASVANSGKALGYVPAGMQNGLKLNALLQDYSVKGLPDIVGYIISAVAGAAILVILFRIFSLIGKSGRDRGRGGTA
ncbi:MAG TPA: cobalt transporter CbiM [Spirochaetia bacterium]|nr:cobalt transporter CbiM [Spirochaetia bacterium]